MRIDLPQCNFKNCRYNFDGNCTNRDKYNYCDYRFAKINAIKEFAMRLKEEFFDYKTDVTPSYIERIIEEMTEEGKE